MSSRGLFLTGNKRLEQMVKRKTQYKKNTTPNKDLWIGNHHRKSHSKINENKKRGQPGIPFQFEYLFMSFRVCFFSSSKNKNCRRRRDQADAIEKHNKTKQPLKRCQVKKYHQDNDTEE